MKITGIEIERFGVWKDLSLALEKSGVSVVYGPNEAGKSTLLRFIRGVLYGFETFTLGSSTGRPRELTWEGTLRVRHREQACEVHRVSSRGTRGLVSVSGLDREEPAESLLREMVNGTDERIFQNVLAVGLSEIQELATFQDDEVARHIYGMTLGPTAQRLLEISAEHQKESTRLLDRQQRTGELIDGIERNEDLSLELESYQKSCREHAELSQELHTLEDQADDLKEERAELEHQLRGHEFLDRVWMPWKQVQDYEAELEGIPEIVDFPEEGSARLDLIERQIHSLTGSQESLLARAAELKDQCASISPPEHLSSLAPMMQAFVDQREWLEESLEELETAETTTGDLRRQLDERLHAIGPGWSLDRLDSVDSSPAAQHRLMTTAARYRSVLARRARLKHQLKRLAAVNHQKTDELNAALRDLNGRPLEEVLDATRREAAGLEELHRLKTRAAEIDSRHRGICEQVRLAEQHPTAPRWFSIFLAVLAFCGIGVTLLGLHFGLTINALGGASFALLGLTGLGIVWGFRQQLGSDGGTSLDHLRDEADQQKLLLEQTRAEIARLTSGHANMGSDSSTDLVSQHVQQLTRLERLFESQQKLLSRRRRLSDLRLRFRSAQREVATERQNWCELLTRLGLVESVRIDAVFEEWRQVLETEQSRGEWKRAEFERRTLSRGVGSFCARMRELNGRLGEGAAAEGDPLSLLTIWDERLEKWSRNASETLRLQEEENRCRAEAAELQSQIDVLRNEERTVLAQGGASCREEFEQRATIVKQRRELEELLTIAREELDAAAGTAPDLAVVEDDLEEYDAEQNAARIASLRQELNDLEAELHSTIENLGRVKQLLRNLEEDERPERVRSEQALAHSELCRKAEEWFALQIAGHALEQVCSKFERTCQPPVLASASRYLERLTRGRYRNIWAPLGRHELRIDDDHGLMFGVEQLSGGTREQLFLAVRLAMIRELARQGIELPMILDDILVNFDQIRTEAAVDTLLEFAGEGQQILFFTCHLHLAHLFESRGIEPIWLPGHNPPIEERLAG